jgi:hypothetical protein
MKKITNYKKAYIELEARYKELSREANRIAPTISALLAAEKIHYAAMEELRGVRDIVIKHDV